MQQHKNTQAMMNFFNPVQRVEDKKAMGEEKLTEHIAHLQQRKDMDVEGKELKSSYLWSHPASESGNHVF